MQAASLLIVEYRHTVYLPEHGVYVAMSTWALSRSGFTKDFDLLPHGFATYFPGVLYQNICASTGDR